MLVCMGVGVYECVGMGMGVGGMVVCRGILCVGVLYVYKYEGSAFVDWKRALNPLGLELQEVMSCPLWGPLRAVHLNCIFNY